MDAPDLTSPLSPADEALLLWIVGPFDPQDPGVLRPTLAEPPDPIAQARFLARPDVQPLFRALMDLRALGAQIRHDHYVSQTIETLLETARTTDDPVEKRRAATAVIRLLLGSPARAPRGGGWGEGSFFYPLFLLYFLRGTPLPRGGSSYSLSSDCSPPNEH